MAAETHSFPTQFASIIVTVERTYFRQPADVPSPSRNLAHPKSPGPACSAVSRSSLAVPHHLLTVSHQTSNRLDQALEKHQRINPAKVSSFPLVFASDIQQTLG
jgi:hypothetical protein